MGKEILSKRKILLETPSKKNFSLNKLSVANKIHIVEPQWNPSIESQAIGRILRLGQKRSVTIIRYIVDGSVETVVQSQQLRKLQLSRGGFGLLKDDHTTQRIEEIKASTFKIISTNVLSDTLSESSLPFAIIGKPLWSCPRVNLKHWITRYELQRRRLELSHLG